MWSRIRYRPVQAVVLALLAALLTTSTCLGPLYQRASEQALARHELAGTRAEERSLRLTADDVRPEDLLALLPASLTDHLGTPVASTRVDVAVLGRRGSVVTRLQATDGACARLVLAAGACPERRDEVVVSDRDVAVNGWEVGSLVEVTQQVEVGADGARVVTVPVRVVGVYRADPAADRVDSPLVGRAGTTVENVGPVTDDWLAHPTAFDEEEPLADWFRPVTSVALPLPVDAGVDALLAVGPEVERLTLPPPDPDDGDLVRTDSGLEVLAADVERGRSQGRTTVVVLVVQLLVLVAVVLWMVLGAAVDARRPELALARLRGRTRVGAARFLLAELVPTALAGVLLGGALAPLAARLVAAAVFPVPVPVEAVRSWTVSGLAGLVAAAVVAAVVVAAVARGVREPLDSLLRGLPSRRPGAAGDVAAVVFSLTAVLALATGALAGPLATTAPTLLAVAGGLLLGRALGPVAGTVSRRLLARGRAVAAAGVATAVRRPAARRVLVMVVVASALAGFCSAALAVAQDNRRRAAEQENGAPVVLALRAPSLAAVTDAVAEVDPRHAHATPVVSVAPESGSRGPTLAVDPVAFARVAYVAQPGLGALLGGALAAPDVAPVTWRGRDLTGVLEFARTSFTGPSDRTGEVQVQAELRRSTGSAQTVTLGTVPPGGGRVGVGLVLPCGQGCVLAGLTIATPPGLAVRTAVTLRDVTLDGVPAGPGPATDWPGVTSGGGTLAARDVPGGLRVAVRTTGSEPPVLRHRWVPVTVPALVTSPEEAVFEAPGLGGPVTMTRAGRLPRVPGAPPGTRVVDLDALRRLPLATAGDTTEVWADSARVADALVAALAERGVVVDARTTVAEVRSDLDASPAAWSLALAALVGGAAVLVAAGVLLVATAAGWRSRAADLAALRMAGLSDRALRRVEVVAQVPVVLVGAVGGGVLGVVAARLAVPGIRQFTVTPEVDTTAFGAPWSVVVPVVVVTAGLLGMLALLAGRWTVGRAALSRILELG